MKIDWHDLSLFLAVADGGGLARGVALTGKSQATLGRHMTRLEQQLGKRLFQRGSHGYALTADGRELVDMARDMGQRASIIATWAQKDAAKPTARISAGTWTATWLATHVTRFWSPDAGFVPEFVTANARLDIARREVDIGIRNARPGQGWLAAQPRRHIAYAPYARTQGISGWIAVSHATSLPPSAQWIKDHHAGDIVTSVNDPRIAAELAAGGVGQVVLPTFTESLNLGLVRTGPVIEALNSREWLASHHEARHDPPIRVALNALATLMS